MPRHGIDISNYQRGLNLAVVPCDFAIMKATEGVSIVHETCDPWVQQCKALGKKWGFYHFLAGLDPVDEADFFVNNCLNYFGEGLPVLDYEMYGRRVGTAGAKRFLDRVYERTKVRCIVYTSRSVLTEEDWSQIAPNHGLWVAQYASNEPTGYQDDPWFPDGSLGGFSAVCIHQYTSSGRLSGYSGNLDLDRCYLSDEQWDAYCRGDREPAVPETPLPDALKGYVDLDPDAWYVPAVERAVTSGWMRGYDSSHFGPNDSLTRAQAVCVIGSAADAEYEHPYYDVTAGTYYYDAVVWAKENGIVDPDFDEFRPEDACTRAEFAVMLHNWQGNPEPVGEPAGYQDWTDVPDWARKAMAWAVERDIVSGSTVRLNPNEPCARAEAAAMLDNLLD